MRQILPMLMLLLALALPAPAQENCPECGMMLMSKFRTKFENGRSWQLYGCMRQHLYWIPTSPALTPTTPSYTNEPTTCPSCGLYLMWIKWPDGEAVSLHAGPHLRAVIVAQLVG